MRTRLVRLLIVVSTIPVFSAIGARAADGPQTSWNVFTLPNPQVTPNWRTYAPAACQSDPDACAKDHRFWEQWNFSNFQTAIDSSFAAVNALGKYHGVMMILPLGDTTAYWNNVQLMYNSAAAHGVQLQTVLFPKWKYGAEYCYLYNNSAPSGCQLLSGTTTALAYQKLLNLVNFVQTLSGSCSAGSFNRQFAVWYGWSNFSPEYGVLKSFWQSLPTNAISSGCNLQASYITWLDTGYSGTAEVQRLQRYVVKQLKHPYWVNTELYSTAQLQQYDTTYAPYQTIITGYWGASDVASWAQGMCTKWNTALQPVRLGAWTFYDQDLASSELYRSYINGAMATIGSICTY
ncbi:MAG TPA: hypothetical protein VH350_18555 [Candidatus Sulfotelmatobacter sp.]|nr:hypothetical protein [Candidatus Sulfotelmatobacter sp.]